MARRSLGALAIAAAVTAIAAVGLGAGVFQGLQPRLVDGLFPATGVDASIALVLIDDASLAEVGRWPWDRSVHADLIDRLAGADTVAYDVTFSEPSERADDAALAEAVASAGNVVLAVGAEYTDRPDEVPQAGVVYPPIPALAQAAAGLGHVSVFPDTDGVVRSLAPFIATPDGDLLPALSVAADHDPSQVSLTPDAVVTGERRIPTGPGHLLDINFTRVVPAYPAADVLSGDVDPAVFDGKTVLVGASAIGLGDHRQTPLDKAEGEPGVLIHANALNTITTGAFLRTESTTTALVWVFALALLAAMGVLVVWLWSVPLVPLGLGVAFVAIAFTRFDGGTVMHLVYPPIALMLASGSAFAFRYATELRERRRVTRIFSRYVAKDVVDEVLAAPDAAVATLDGASPEISVLFADLRGFTAASEQLAPTEVVSALNVFLDAMTRAVVEERGTVDKFMGDCVMAFWNAPRREPEHAAHAVRAAVRMIGYIDEAMRDGLVASLPVRGCGIGVATGEAVVGNIGSHQRLDYTVIGDTVNTASRLCGVAEAGQVVVTKATADAVGEGFDLELIPPVSVKGKEQPLEVYRVVITGDVPATIREPSKAAGYAPIEPVPQRDA